MADALTTAAGGARRPLSDPRAGHGGNDTLRTCAELVDLIVGRARMRGQLQRAELRLDLQVKAIGRSLAHFATASHDGAHGDSTPFTAMPPSEDVVVDESLLLTHLAARPLIEARDHIRRQRLIIEKQLTADAKALPVWPWVAAVRGAGALGLALIVGEAGALSLYGNPAKLWKRMGLAVIDGRSQRRVADPEAALRQGYVPRRRSLMHVLGDALIKNNRDGEFRTLYLTRKTYEQAKAPDLRPIVHHKRALRYMEKRFLLELWRAWRTAAGIPSEAARSVA